MCAISSTRIAKIILGRVKVKDLTIRIFYNFFYILSQGIIAAIYRKRSIKKPPSKFHVLEACKKNTLFDWAAWWKSLLFIIRFSRGEADQVSGTLLMVECGQILPFSSTHRGFILLISSEICWDIELIFTTCVIIL